MKTKSALNYSKTTTATFFTFFGKKSKVCFVKEKKTINNNKTFDFNPKGVRGNPGKMAKFSKTWQSYFQNMEHKKYEREKVSSRLYTRVQ